MTAIEFEATLLHLGENAADFLRREIADRERRVSELTRRIEPLAGRPGPEARAAELESEQARLAETILRLERKAGEVCEGLLSRARVGIAAVRAEACCQVLADAEALFHDLAPGDLREAVSRSSPAMLGADLAGSGLPGLLQERLGWDVAACCRELAEGREALQKLAEAQSEVDAVRRQMQKVSARLTAHNVSSEVLRSLEMMEEPDWFLEDLVEPYTRAAVVESGWQLPRNVFKELGYAG
jgi:hypothetical protein